MTLKMKWHLRQIGLEVFSYILCFTTAFIVIPIAVRYYHFVQFGFGMYPGIEFPKSVSIGYAAHAFWELSAWPVLQYLPLALIADAAFRRFGWRLSD